MKRWFYKRWVWAGVLGTTTALGAGLAQTGGKDAPTGPPKVGDVITLKFRDGPDRQVKVLKSEKQPDGSYLSEVKDAKSGEVFSLVDRPGDVPPTAGDKTMPKSTDSGPPKAKSRPYDPLLPSAKDPMPPTPADKKLVDGTASKSPAAAAAATTATSTQEPEERPNLLRRIFGKKKPATPPTPLSATNTSANATNSANPGPAMPPPVRPPPGAGTANTMPLPFPGSATTPTFSGSATTPAFPGTGEPPRTRPVAPVTPPVPLIPMPVPTPPVVTRIPPPVVTPTAPPVATPTPPPVATPAPLPLPSVPSAPMVPALPNPPMVPAVPSKLPPIPLVPSSPVPTPGTLPMIPIPPGGTPLNPPMVVPAGYSPEAATALMRDIQPHVTTLQTTLAPTERAMAIRAMARGRHGASETVTGIVFRSAQNDPCPMVRAVCIEELHTLGFHDAAFVTFLQKMSADSPTEVKTAAKNALTPRK